jgi:hypothetical protein
MADQDSAYTVGYGKPPRANRRFQQGVSGNPKGRPKGRKNLATVVIKESQQRVRVNGPGGSRTVTKLEAAIMQLVNKSAQGDLRASREFISLIQRSEENVDSGGSIAFSELDQQVIAGLRRRMENISTPHVKSEKEK